VPAGQASVSATSPGSVLKQAPLREGCASLVGMPLDCSWHADVELKEKPAQPTAESQAAAQPLSVSLLFAASATTFAEQPALLVVLQ
jgi:hypothetical protein